MTGPSSENTAERSAPRVVARVWAVITHDIGRAFWHGWVNALGGSVLLPRAARWAIYRIAGLDFRTANISPRCTFTHRQVSIGSRSFLNIGVFCEGEPIVIGDNTQIGPEVLFATAHHPMDGTGASSMGFERRKIEVGDDCTLGARVVVLPGVMIASRITVAAGAVVTKDLTEPGLYAGVPARLIRAGQGS